MSSSRMPQIPPQFVQVGVDLNGNPLFSIAPGAMAASESDGYGEMQPGQIEGINAAASQGTLRPLRAAPSPPSDTRHPAYNGPTHVQSSTVDQSSDFDANYHSNEFCQMTLIALMLIVSGCLLIAAATLVWADDGSLQYFIYKRCAGDTCEKTTLSELKDCESDANVPTVLQKYCRDLQAPHVALPMAIPLFFICAGIIMYPICKYETNSKQRSQWSIGAMLTCLSAILCSIVSFSLGDAAFKILYDEANFSRGSGYNCAAAGMAISCAAFVIWFFIRCCQRQISSPYVADQEMQFQASPIYTQSMRNSEPPRNVVYFNQS